MSNSFEDKDFSFKNVEGKRMMSNEKEDAKKPEPSKFDGEVEELFREAEYVQRFDTIPMVNIKPKEEKYDIACLDGSDHDFFLDDDIGFVCTKCDIVKQDIKEIYPQFVTTRVKEGSAASIDEAAKEKKK